MRGLTVCDAIQIIAYRALLMEPGQSFTIEAASTISANIVDAIHSELATGRACATDIGIDVAGANEMALRVDPSSSKGYDLLTIARAS